MEIGDVVARLPGVSAADLVFVGAGTDHSVWRAGEFLLRRPLEEAGAAAEVAAEAVLLAQVAALVPVNVPEVVSAEDGTLVTRWIPGRPLLEDRADPMALAPLLGEVLSILHSTPLREAATWVESDVFPLEDWLEDAAVSYRAVRLTPIPFAIRRRIRAFLAAPPPPPADRLGFCHADLGAEHLLVEGGRLTGIIDWSDAAIADPALDLGRLLRDLGPDVLAEILRHYRQPVDEAFLARVRFYARCTLLEDLEYGRLNRDRTRTRFARSRLKSMFGRVDG